ncbi:MAG: FG-GAP repeat protein, partial [Roseomonas sp.]|nr:FG-GAP repeat protein [Roseomonas sp.]
MSQSLAPINLADVAGGTGGFVINGRDAFDFSGWSVASAGDVNGDGFADLIIGAWLGDGAGGSSIDNRGESYVVFGKPTGWAAAIDLAAIAGGTGGFVINGRDPDDRSGISVASAGDINGDGFADLIIGAPQGDGASATNRGESYVVFGKASGWGAINLNDIALGTGGFVINGRDAYDRSGYSVASAGDINGDGFDDLIIGAPSGDGTSTNNIDQRGESYVVFGKASGWGAAINLADIAGGTGGFVINGRDAGDFSGFSVASAGDVNGDGFADLIIGARYGDGARTDLSDNRGESYVVFGKAASDWGAEINLADIAGGTGGFVINGWDADDRSGVSVASAGDINGDGFDDLIIGAPGAGTRGTSSESRGESYVIFGRDFTLSVTHAGTDGDDTLTGTAGADVMVGGLGNDTLDGGGGADALEGGAGNDLIQVADLNFRDVDGGSGNDMLALTGSGLTLNLASIGDTKLQGIEAIDLGAGGNLLRLTALEVLNLSDTTNTLRVTGGAGAGLTFDDLGWVRGATAGGFTTYSNGQAQVEVQTGVQRLNAPIDLTTIAAGTGGFVIHGQDGNDRSGWSVASAGDINGDGFADLIIGATNGDAAGNAKTNAGDSYVVFGKA